MHFFSFLRGMKGHLNKWCKNNIFIDLKTNIFEVPIPSKSFHRCNTFSIKIFSSTYLHIQTKWKLCTQDGFYRNVHSSLFVIAETRKDPSVYLPENGEVPHSIVYSDSAILTQHFRRRKLLTDKTNKQTISWIQWKQYKLYHFTSMMYKSRQN